MDIILVFSILAFITVPAIALFQLTLDIALRRCLLGKRVPGTFNWDSHVFQQRWKLLTSLQRVYFNDHVTRALGGSWWIVCYFRRCGAHIGKNVCLYPWGSNVMMIEPELNTIGDGSCFEDAHLVAHLNTKGNFTLDRIKVGRNCTLRSGTRIQQCGEMQDESTLLEHSLVMAGEVVPEGAVWQGYPNRWKGHHVDQQSDIEGPAVLISLDSSGQGVEQLRVTLR